MPASKITLAKRVAELERQLEEMKAAMTAQTVKPAEVAPKAMAAAAAAGAGGIAPSLAGKGAATITPEPAKDAARVVTGKKETASDEISPEILAVIAAAVAHFCGKSFRIRSARLVHPVGTSPWAQQGRVFIQASHNLALSR